jgi:hypothetical protein
MKTKYFISVMLLYSACYILNAQIKVNANNGYVGIGSSTTPLYPVVISLGSYGAGIRANYNMNNPIFEPVTNNTGWLGSTNYWSKLYVTDIWCPNAIHPSDLRIKENISEINSTNALKKNKNDKKLQIRLQTNNIFVRKRLCTR